MKYITAIFDFSKHSSCDHRSKPKIKIIPNIRAKIVVIIAQVLRALLLSLQLGKNLTNEKSRPNPESITSIIIDEIIAVAIPTSFVGYNLAARIQKIRPNPDVVNEVSIREIEFLYNGSFKN